MIDSKYLRYLLFAVLLWLILYFVVTLFVNPYGISPLRWTIQGINEYKPARVNIDRQLKPYEVWRDKPTTLFLGTSRIHQAMNPAELVNTDLAPAYNASIPASTLEMNVAHLKEYVKLNPNLRTVVVELFFYNFLRASTKATTVDNADFFKRTVGLFISGDSFTASLLTVAKNASGACPCYEVKPGGYFSYPDGHDARGPFGGFPAGIWKLHDTRNDFQLSDSAFSAVADLMKISREHHLDIRLVLTPSHIYDDYYLDAIGAWGTIEAWLQKLVMLAPIDSFAQPNAWAQEPVARHMRYWYDPYHFTLNTGRTILATLFHGKPPDAPPGFHERLTAEKIPALIAHRKLAVQQWAESHPQFVKQFEAMRTRHYAATNKVRERQK